jgi:polysaccharide pyruvyl transferase WcaK-like protein
VNVAVLGWYDNFNIGDESYKVAFTQLLPGHNLTFVGHSSKIPVDTDHIILGGGDIVYADFARGIPEDIPLTIASVSLTENSCQELIRRSGSKALFKGEERAGKVIVRDSYSTSFAPDAEIYPDFAFVLTPDRKNGSAFLRDLFHAEKIELYDRVVAVVIGGKLASLDNTSSARDSAAFAKFSQDLADIADTTPASFVFLSMSTHMPWDDRVPAFLTASRCKWWKKNTVVADRLSPQTMLDIISASDAVISGRLHSTIFATIAGVNFIDVTTHTKNRGFMSSLGLGDFNINMWDFSKVDAVSLLREHLSEGRSERLANYTANAKVKLSGLSLL